MVFLTPFPLTTPSPSPKLRAFHLLLGFQSLFSLSSVARLNLLLTAALSCWQPCPPDSLLLCSPSAAPWVLLFAGHLWSSLCLRSTLLSFPGLLFFFYDSYHLVPKRRDKPSQCWERAFLSFPTTVFSNPIKQNMPFQPSRLFSSCFPSSPSLPYQSSHPLPMLRCSGLKITREINLSERVLIHGNREDEI